MRELIRDKAKAEGGEVQCTVCCGLGYYPIINNRGRELYAIKCPECFGDGNVLQEPQK